MTFVKEISKHPWNRISEEIAATTPEDVTNALRKSGNRTLEDFKALISPAAGPFLEEMAELSRKLTLKRFGKILQMYIPLYLSNKCVNGCVYCGFNKENAYPRKVLSESEILEEVMAIKAFGYDHILLVTGEAPQSVGLKYFKNALKIIAPHFSHISMEVQPMAEEEYRELMGLGLNTVLIYQETYRMETYGSYHPAGAKKSFPYRLETPERLGRAGIHKIGLGFLIGLEDWRIEALFTAMHLQYMERKFWKTRYTISFPRLRPNAGNFQPRVNISNRELVQLICAYRIFNENVELSLSTRESGPFRNNIIKLGITSISAG
jgi:2-iminoacetate synthase